jgi:dethiobiotin synthetase
MKTIGIVGIDTEVGKTICSAIVTEALQADFWKMLQAGDLHQLDSETVKSLISNSKTKFHKERYLLTEPMSPHAAANIDNIIIEIGDFELPKTENALVIEGAGGLMVPINEKGDMVVDLMAELVDEVILVTKNYLGSINHTLLSVEVLKQKGLKIKGLIFNGDSNPESERIIQKLTGLKVIGKIPKAISLEKEFVKKMADQIIIE